MIVLRCGLILDGDNLDRLFEAERQDIIWNEMPLDAAPGMENLEESIYWPASIAGVSMPDERIAFFRRFHDKDDGKIGYCVESLAEAVSPGRTSFFQQDFRVLLTTTSLEEAEETVVNEIRRFLMVNIA